MYMYINYMYTRIHVHTNMYSINTLRIPFPWDRRQYLRKYLITRRKYLR